MLLTTVAGDEALRIEAQDNSQTLEEVMQVLRNMYGDGIPNATGTMNQCISAIDGLADRGVVCNGSCFIYQRFQHISETNGSFVLY